VSLAPLVQHVDDAAYLSGAITELLDSEWIPQPCHATIGVEVGALYLAARRRGEDDLGAVLVELGDGLAGFDLGDAFVGPWDVANAAADLLLLRLGRDTCACSDQGALASAVAAAEARSADTVAAAASTPTLSDDFDASKVEALRPSLESGFGRYKFLAAALGGDVAWPLLSAAVNLALGFRPAPAASGAPADCSRVGADARELLRGHLVPVKIGPGAPLLRQLEEALPEDGSDARQGLLEFLGVLHGDTALRIALAERDGDFLARCLAVQWLHHTGFLNHPDLLPPPPKTV
jgi:hypothetical protein